MTLKWGPQFRVELTPRLEEWLEDIRLRNPHYTNEEILFAALVCGLDLPHQTKEPAARQLLASLYTYVASPGFKPSQEFSGEMLDKLFVPTFANKL